MKAIQFKFKMLLLVLLVGIAFTSCRNGKDGEASNDDSNLEQVDASNTDDAGDANSDLQKDSSASITEEDGDATSPNSPKGNTAPLTLDCNYFKDNPNTVLKDNPEAPIDYIITCFTRIDGKLTIEPGVVIAFEQNAGMEFKDKSSFSMIGTAAKPILLTGKEKTPGFWRGIYTESPNSNNVMNYVTIDYAGGGNSKSALAIYGEASSIKMENCTVSNSKFTGMFVRDDVAKDVNNINMKNSTFTKNNIPVKTNITRLNMFNGSNSFSGNKNDYVYIDRENLKGDATWSKLDVPYFLQNNFRYQDGVLTVEPGVEIIISAQNWMHLSNKASLVMVGTAAEPIIIRGEHDVAGFWQQLNIDSSSPLNEIGHVIFKNAGRTTEKPNGAIFLGDSKFLNIHDVVFSNCFEYGMSLQNVKRSHLEQANLTLDKTPKLFSDYGGKELADIDIP
ncbi:hypothetical protein Aeqsu_2104 [Aequorivita sublithincola DSM 14238]|uniref:Right handed beta helix domain-containing protein n=1 Tax=Aequorivita sublithincola (strain DSM 14238 / LMG 21431 / ACAM 643 / 9-3) TaxID=746697 RepID=I3YX49_AEQSU|nr:hypothetical protein [Aequorivita sublithincola]AFL81567.1 hypothetical protein Aeqsu_2104 [Aequorivita sublithincola DSM 14238]